VIFGLQVENGSITESSVTVKIRLPETAEDGTIFFICLKENVDSPWVHTGNETESWLQVKVGKH